MTKESKGKAFLSKLGTLMALIILCVVLTIATPKFLTVTNLMNVLKQTSVNALIASGMLVCLITAGIDLSVGANAVTCACIMGMLKEMGVSSSFVLILSALITGTFIGWINGTLLTRLHLPHPFVSTLGVKNILCGVALLVVNSKMVSNFPNGVTWLGSYSVATTKTFPGVPVSFIA